LLRRDPDVRGHSKRGLPSLLDRLATLARAREQDGRHELIASRRFLTPAWRRVDLRADHSSKV
jgi:hypothetical protein